MKPQHKAQWDDMPCDEIEKHYALCEYGTVN